MDKNKFNSLVRPYVHEIRYGSQSVGYDRLDLDAWFDDYKQRNGRPGKAYKEEGQWDKRSHRDLSSVVTRTTSRKSSVDKELDNQLERILSRKQNDT